MASDYEFIGQGVYSLVDAARLTDIPARRIARWMEGYDFTSSGRAGRSEPIITPRWGRIGGALALSFAQLIEIRFVDAFRDKGVSWRSIRIASERARTLIGAEYPFSNKKFKTDGKTILLEVTRRGGRTDLLDLVRNQYEIHKMVSPMLFSGVEFNQFDRPNRWWPMGRRKRVVIDPERSFGAPIVSREGVPTAILAASARAERSQRRTAQIYDVDLVSVRHAVEFENHAA